MKDKQLRVRSAESFRPSGHRRAAQNFRNEKGQNSRNRQMGHADLRMTMKYVHLTPVHLRTAIAKLDSFSYTSPAVAQSVSGPFSESIAPSSGQDEILSKVATNAIN